MISCGRQSTVGALMPTLRQCLADCCATEAGLTCAARIDAYQLSSSFCRFVRQFRDERRPPGIFDGFRQHAIRQRLDIQVFHGNHAVGIYKLRVVLC